MCFVPQCRALFRQLNFQKYPQVLRTRQFLTLLTSKCDSRHNCVHFFNIATPKGARSMRFFSILTSRCASRHTGVQNFISHLARWLRTRRFREPTFRPSGATNHWKTKCYATFLPFARLHLFSSDSFCSLIFFLLLLSSLTLPTSAFSSVHIVGSLASKLPSIIR